MDDQPVNNDKENGVGRDERGRFALGCAGGPLVWLVHHQTTSPAGRQRCGRRGSAGARGVGDARRFRRYGLSMDWLRREADAGRIPSFKAGRRLLFDADTVEGALIERARGNANGEPAPGKGVNRD